MILLAPPGGDPEEILRPGVDSTPGRVSVR
jgi:hypothetical protein